MVYFTVKVLLVTSSKILYVVEAAFALLVDVTCSVPELYGVIGVCGKTVRWQDWHGRHKNKKHR